MSDAFERYSLDGKDKLIVKLLEEMNDKLARVIELLERQGRPSPS